MTALTPPRTERFKRLQPAGLLDFCTQVFNVAVAKDIEQTVIERVAGTGHHIGQDDSIGSPSDWNALERMGVADDLFACAIHRPDARASGEYEGAIDIKEDECAHRVWEPIYNRRSGG
jgi:hypothetical protein